MEGARSGDVVFDLSTVGPESTPAQHARMAERHYKAGFLVDLASKDLGLGLELPAAAGAKTDVGPEVSKLYGQAREAGLGRLDSSGLPGLLEPEP